MAPFRGNQHAAGEPSPTSRKERTSKERKAAGGQGVDEKLGRDVRKGRDEYAVGDGKKCPSCGGTVAADRKTCQNCGHSFGTLSERIVELEAAVLALAAIELGDRPGHEFRGNQFVVIGTQEAYDEISNGGSERIHSAGPEHAALEVTSPYAAKEILSRHPGASSYTNSLDAEHHVILGHEPRIGDVVHGVTRVGSPSLTHGTRVPVTAAGNPDALRKWFNDGADGKVDWGQPGDFDACVAEASKHMSDDQAKGFCNERHQDATGEAPGHAPGEEKK